MVDGAYRDHQPGRDLGVGQPAPDQAEDLLLALGQPRRDCAGWPTSGPGAPPTPRARAAAGASTPRRAAHPGRRTPRAPPASVRPHPTPRAPAPARTNRRCAPRPQPRPASHPAAPPRTRPGSPGTARPGARGGPASGAVHRGPAPRPRGSVRSSSVIAADRAGSGPTGQPRLLQVDYRGREQPPEAVGAHGVLPGLRHHVVGVGRALSHRQPRRRGTGVHADEMLIDGLTEERPQPATSGLPPSADDEQAVAIGLQEQREGREVAVPSRKRCPPRGARRARRTGRVATAPPRGWRSPSGRARDAGVPGPARCCPTGR